MAGRGPAPKPEDQRAGKSAPPVPITHLGLRPAKQPALPRSVEWPAQTRKWWAMWRRSAQAQLFTDTDWDFLLDTALLHREVWLGDLRALQELRLRVAKLGATPEDRLRLRMQLAPEAETQPKQRSKESARTKYAGLSVVPGGAGAVAGS